MSERTLFRFRALDEVDDEKSKWFNLNPLFKSYTNIFDFVFNRGTNLDLNYYLRRISNDDEYEHFEIEFICKLFDDLPNADCKITKIVGKVGTGKTAFSNFMKKELLENYSKYKILPIHIDTFNQFVEDVNAESKIEILFKREIENVIICNNHIDTDYKTYKTKYEYYKDICEDIGFNDLSQATIFLNRDKIKFDEYLHHLLNLNNYRKIIIIIDNIDESMLLAIQACKSFVEYIEKYHFEIGSETKLHIIIPIREYINTLYFDIEHFAKKELPELDYGEFVKIKLVELNDYIYKDSRQHKQSFPYSFIKNNKVIMQNRNFVFTRKVTAEFISELAKRIFKDNERSFVDILKKLSSGNLKILVGNLYNFFHSYKIPLYDLFLKFFAVDYDVNVAHKNTTIDFGLLIECLMCIHYPFFDVENSFIINLFNCMNSYKKDDYQNTLTIIRLLLLIDNTKGLNFNIVISKFIKYTYSKKYVNDAIQKCLNYGLIESSNGYNIKHFSDDTIISGNSSTKLYLYKIVSSIHYLQYACEDVPMTRDYLISVNTKYFQDKSYRGSKERRGESAINLIKFIDDEEKREELKIKHKKLDYYHFLFEMSYIVDGKGIKVSEFLSKSLQ